MLTNTGQYQMLDSVNHNKTIMRQHWEARMADLPNGVEQEEVT